MLSISVNNILQKQLTSLEKVTNFIKNPVFCRKAKHFYPRSSNIIEI